MTWLKISPHHIRNTLYGGTLKKRALIIVGTFHMSPWPFLANWYRSRRLIGYLISNKSTKIHIYTLQLGTLFRSSSNRGGKKNRRHIDAECPGIIEHSSKSIPYRLKNLEGCTRSFGNFRLFCFLKSIPEGRIPSRFRTLPLPEGFNGHSLTRSIATDKLVNELWCC